MESSESVRTPRWVYRKGGKKEGTEAKEEGKAAGFTVHLATYVQGTDVELVRGPAAFQNSD